jgi:hypothetical protein
MDVVYIIGAVFAGQIGLFLWLRTRLRRSHQAVRDLERTVKKVKGGGKGDAKLEKLLRTELKVTEYAYDSDCLRVWNKTTDFMEDPAFQRAYKAGMFSGHRISQGAETGVDIHIEWRIHTCCWAGKHAAQVEGDFVECGVNTGIFSLALCEFIDFNATGKRFFLFDTYEGIPEDQITEEEKGLRRGEVYADLYEDCFELAKKNFEKYPRAELVRGRVPESLGTVEIEKVAYLSIDMNIVEPEIAAMEFFWDKIVPGGVVVLDDYGWADHHAQRRAMDAFAARRGVAILNLPTGQGLLVKP